MPQIGDPQNPTGRRRRHHAPHGNVGAPAGGGYQGTGSPGGHSHAHIRTPTVPYNPTPARAAIHKAVTGHDLPSAKTPKASAPHFEQFHEKPTTHDVAKLDTHKYLKQHFELDKQGRPKTQPLEVPVPKRPQEKVDADYARFTRAVSDLHAHLPAEAAHAARQHLLTQLVRRNYKIKGGRVMTKTVDVLVPKGKHDPTGIAARHATKRLTNLQTRALRKHKRQYLQHIQDKRAWANTPEAPEGTNIGPIHAPSPGEALKWATTAVHLTPAAPTYVPGVGVVQEGPHSTPKVSPLEAATFAIPELRGVKAALELHFPGEGALLSKIIGRGVAESVPKKLAGPIAKGALAAGEKIPRLAKIGAKFKNAPFKTSGRYSIYAGAASGGRFAAHDAKAISDAWDKVREDPGASISSLEAFVKHNPMMVVTMAKGLASGDVRRNTLYGLGSSAFYAVTFPFLVGYDLATKGATRTAQDLGGSQVAAVKPFYDAAAKGDWKQFHNLMSTSGSGGELAPLMIEVPGLAAVSRLGRLGLDAGALAKGGKALYHDTKVRPTLHFGPGEGEYLAASTRPSKGVLRYGQRAADNLAIRLARTEEGARKRGVHQTIPGEPRPTERGYIFPKLHGHQRRKYAARLAAEQSIAESHRGKEYVEKMHAIEAKHNNNPLFKYATEYGATTPIAMLKVLKNLEAMWERNRVPGEPEGPELAAVSDLIMQVHERGNKPFPKSFVEDVRTHGELAYEHAAQSDVITPEQADIRARQPQTELLLDTQKHKNAYVSQREFHYPRPPPQPHDVVGTTDPTGHLPTRESWLFRDVFRPPTQLKDKVDLGSTKAARSLRQGHLFSRNGKIYRVKKVSRDFGPHHRNELVVMATQMDRVDGVWRKTSQEELFLKPDERVRVVWRKRERNPEKYSLLDLSESAHKRGEPELAARAAKYARGGFEARSSRAANRVLGKSRATGPARTVIGFEPPGARVSFFHHDLPSLRSQLGPTAARVTRLAHRSAVKNRMKGEEELRIAESGLKQAEKSLEHRRGQLKVLKAEARKGKVTDKRVARMESQVKHHERLVAAAKDRVKQAHADLHGLKDPETHKTLIPGLKTMERRTRLERLKALAASRKAGRSDHYTRNYADDSGKYIMEVGPAKLEAAAARQGQELPGYWSVGERQPPSGKAHGARGSRKLVVKRSAGITRRAGKADTRALTQHPVQARLNRTTMAVRAQANKFKLLTFPLSRLAEGITSKSTLAQTEHALINAGVDMSNIDLVNKGRFDEERNKLLARHNTQVTTELPAEGGVQASFEAGIRAALKEATVTTDAEGRLNMRGLEDTTGWVGIGKAQNSAFLNTLSPSMSGLAQSRFVKLMSRTKLQASQWLLLHPSWLIAQHYAQATTALTGIPKAIFDRGYHDWLNHLDTKERQEFLNHVGVPNRTTDYGQAGHAYWASIMGIKDAAEASRRNKFYQSHVRKRGLIGLKGAKNMFFGQDVRQNTFWNSRALHSLMKDEAHKLVRMEKHADGIMGLLDNALSKALDLPSDVGRRIMDMPNPELDVAMSKVLSNRKLMEELADRVHSFNGDYLNYGVGERAFIANNLLFYGFMRHSLMLALWTLPVKHPMRAVLIADAGMLVEREQKRAIQENTRRYLAGLYYGQLMQTPLVHRPSKADAKRMANEAASHYRLTNNEIPFNMWGNFVFPGSDLSIGLRRASFVGSTPIEAIGKGHLFSAFSSFSPLVGIPVELATGVDPYSGAPLYTQPEKGGRPGYNPVPLDQVPTTTIALLANYASLARDVSQSISKYPTWERQASSFPLPGPINPLPEKPFTYATRAGREKQQFGVRVQHSITAATSLAQNELGIYSNLIPVNAYFHVLDLLKKSAAIKVNRDAKETHWNKMHPSKPAQSSIFGSTPGPVNPFSDHATKQPAGDSIFGSSGGGSSIFGAKPSKPAPNLPSASFATKIAQMLGRVFDVHPIDPLGGSHALKVNPDPNSQADAPKHARYALPGPYVTKLPTGQEQKFRAWVKDQKIPYDLKQPISQQDYDMRGYFKAKGPVKYTKGTHFPDTFKTPLHESFSSESKYANAKNPYNWHGDKLVNDNTGKVIFSDAAPKKKGKGATPHAKKLIASFKSAGPAAEAMAAAAVRYGKENGIPPSVLMSIGKIETALGGNVNTSTAGAQGYMQFMPETAKGIEDKYGVNALGGPDEAVHAAALLLKDAGYATNPHDAIYSYNHAEWYVNDVMNGQAEFGKLDKLAPKAVGAATGSVQVAKALPHRYRKFIVKKDGDEHLRFEPLFAKALVKLGKLSGEPVVVNSGFRTLAEQKASYADYQAGGALAAVPGTSNHEFGRAADLVLTDKQRGLLDQAGLSLPVPGEDWHVELSDPAARAQAGYDQATTPALGSSGGTVSSAPALGSGGNVGAMPGNAPNASPRVGRFSETHHTYFDAEEHARKMQELARGHAELANSLHHASYGLGATPDVPQDIGSRYGL